MKKMLFFSLFNYMLRCHIKENGQKKNGEEKQTILEQSRKSTCLSRFDDDIEKQLFFFVASFLYWWGSELVPAPRAKQWNKEASVASSPDDVDFLFRSFFIFFFFFSFFALSRLVWIFFFNVVCFLSCRRAERSETKVSTTVVVAADDDEHTTSVSSFFSLLLRANTFRLKEEPAPFNFHVRSWEIIKGICSTCVSFVSLSKQSSSVRSLTEQDDSVNVFLEDIGFSIGSIDVSLADWLISDLAFDELSEADNDDRDVWMTKPADRKSNEWTTSGKERRRHIDKHWLWISASLSLSTPLSYFLSFFRFKENRLSEKSVERQYFHLLE